MKISWQKAQLYQYFTIWVSLTKIFVFFLQGFHRKKEDIITSGITPKFSNTICFLHVLSFLSSHLWPYNSHHLKLFLSSFLLSQISPFLKDKIHFFSNFSLLCKPTLSTPTLLSLITKSLRALLFIFFWHNSIF